jgi:hypothetical protein
MGAGGSGSASSPPIFLAALQAPNRCLSRRACCDRFPSTATSSGDTGTSSAAFSLPAARRLLGPSAEVASMMDDDGDPLK